MNTKTARQIEEMKKQTIGVEVEMNNITRNKAAKSQPSSSAQADLKTQPTETATALGQHMTSKAESGNSKRMSASQDPTARSAKWLHQSLPTQTLKPCRSL